MILVGCKNNGKSGNGSTQQNPAITKIEIFSVTVDGRGVAKGETIGVQDAQAQLAVVFKENYEGLSLTISSDGKQTSIPINNTNATYKLTDLTENEKEFSLVAKAKGRTDETYTFKVRKVGVARIEELTFIGDELNPNAAGSQDANKLTYSADATSALPLSTINNDGTHKIGTTKSYMLEVQVKVQASAKEKMLKIENRTNNKNATTTNVANDTLKTKIPLKTGDNHLVVTYTEEGKNYVAYKLIVGYKEPDYSPIDVIEFNGGQRYNNSAGFEKLKTGNETIQISGEAKLPVSVKMEKLWYDEEGWALKIDGQNVDKQGFNPVSQGSGSNTVTTHYIVNKVVDLSLNNKKLVVINFANPNRNYSVEYKIVAIHTLSHNLDALTYINHNTKEYVAEFKAFLKDSEKANHYNLEGVKEISDWTDKLTFVFETGSKSAKYALLQQEKAPESITSEWQTTTKQTTKYIKGGEELEKTGYVGEATIEHGISYLYIALEGDGLVSYYSAKIKRKKEGNQDTQLFPLKPEKITFGADGKPVPNDSPFGKWGVIRFKPKNPRAKIKITMPETKELQLSSDKACFEYKIELNQEVTTVKYKVIAEDGTHESQEMEVKFEKKQIVRGVRFHYSTEPTFAIFAGMNKSNVKGGEYYIPVVEKSVIKEENKPSMIAIAFAFDQDVTHSCDELTENMQIKKEDDITIDHVKAQSYTYKIDVTNVLQGTQKDYTIKFLKGTESAGEAKIHLFKANQDITAIKVWQGNAMEFPNNEYIFDQKIDHDTVQLIVEVPGKVKQKNETLEDTSNTKRNVTFEYDGTSAKNGVISAAGFGFKQTIFLFTLNNFPLPASGNSKEVTIKYYEDKTNNTVTKTCRLTIKR